MGGSSKQVTGYKYFANFLLFIGNPIEKLLGINFDKRGWAIPLLDDQGNPLDVGTINKPNLFGENEGGVAGQIYARYGTANPMPVSFYTDYLAENDLPPLAYPFQSYLAFEDFYLGNSDYPKEMLLWPKRIHVKNDGSPQWYSAKAEIATEVVHSIPEGSGIVAFSYIRKNIWKYSGSSYESISNRNFSLVDASVSYVFNSHFLTSTVSPFKFSVLIDPTNAKGFCKVRAIIDVLLDGLTIDIDSMEPTIASNFISFDISKEPTSPSGENYIRYIAEGFADLSAPETGIDVVFKSIGRVGVIYEVFFDYPHVAASTYIPTGDINPIHKIREILTDDTAMNKPESDVNDVNFTKAADRIWDEQLGISWAITEKSCIDAINELCSHIEAGVRVNRQTGLYEMVLFRDDWFKEDEIHVLAESKIKSISFEVQNADDVVNQLNVSYYDRNNIKNASFSISENASIKNMHGRVNAESADFPYFMNQRNAAIVAQWKLKQFTTPCWKGTFTTGYNEARKWNRYDIVKLNWSRKGIVDLPVRIMSINLGDGIDNTVSINFVEVVPFSDELASTIVIDDKIDVKPQPPLPCQYEPFELPYYFAVMALGQRKTDEELAYDNDFGLVGVVAERPQSNSLYAVMMTNNGDAWERAGSIQYSETADSDQVISRTSSSFTVKNWKKIANVEVGTLIKCGSDWIGTPSEWMVFQGVDPYTGVVSVKRGALDSLPQPWGADTKLYFCTDDIAYDPTEYIAGEEVLVSALTTTPSGMLENLGSIPTEMKARAIRPYPPANVKINGEYFPDEIETDLIMTWVDRNRQQQTGGSILGWYESGITLEGDVKYEVEIRNSANDLSFYAENLVGNEITIDDSELVAQEVYTLKLSSKRDGYYCFQPLIHSFRKIGGFIPVDVFVTSNSAANTNNSNTLTIPITANSETQYLCAILVGRADTSLTIPSGWSLIKTETTLVNANPLISMKYWILTKAYSGDSSASFDFSRAATQGVVVSLKSDVVNSFSSLNSDTLIATKSNEKNSLLAITFANRFNSTASNMSIVRNMDGFTVNGESLYEASSIIYHSLFVFKQITDLTTNINVSTDQLIIYDAGTAKSIVVLEVEQP